MIRESHVIALLRLIQHGKVSKEDIKDADYKAEVAKRLNVQQT